MKERFGVRKTKRDGTEGKVVTIPPMHVLQMEKDSRFEWIDYSALDAKVGEMRARGARKTAICSCFVTLGSCLPACHANVGQQSLPKHRDSAAMPMLWLSDAYLCSLASS